MTRIALVGLGLVGRAWAVSYARAGYDVALFDEKPEAADAALRFAEEAARSLAAEGLLGDSTPEEVLTRLHRAASLEAALEGAEYVQESTFEDLEVKRAVYARLDAAAAPETVLASSTSAILPSKFSEGLEGRARCLVAHPINPPYLIPVVEIVPAPWTEPAAIARTSAILKGAGHAPVVMKREIDGFLVNRLQGALLEEAFRLVAEGYAGVEDIDACLREGLALRWSFMGPFETIDLNAPGGVRDYARRYEPMYEAMTRDLAGRRADWSGPAMDEIEAERRALTPASDLAARQLWRDRRLMALLAHKREAAKTHGE